MRILADDDVAAVLDLRTLLDVVDGGLRAQGAGRAERPDRPHFPVGQGIDGDDPLGTGLAMPAYVHGATHYATKLASVHPGNRGGERPVVQAQILLTEAATGAPAALLAGTRITNARTGCIGGLAVRELASERPDGVDLAVLGAGQQARWQTRAIAAATDVERVRVYSPSDSRERCVADLRAAGIPAEAVDSPEAAVRDATVVVTATTSSTPVFDGDDLAPGTLVVAVGAYTPEMREIDARTVERSAQIFADVPEEVATIGDMRDVDGADIHPLSAVLEGDVGRTDDDEVVLVESVGTAVLDAAAAEHLYERAVERELGVEVTLD